MTKEVLVASDDGTCSKLHMEVLLRVYHEANTVVSLGHIDLLVDFFILFVNKLFLGVEARLERFKQFYHKLLVNVVLPVVNLGLPLLV